MERLRTESGLFQHLSQLVHHDFRIAEDQAEIGLVILQEPDTGRLLILLSHLIVSLGDQRNGQLLRRHLHQPGILLEPVRNLQNGLGHGCREKGGLVLPGNLPENQLHVLPEPHVQHFIRLVQHHHIHIVQLYRMTAHMIHDAPGRTHDNLHIPEPPDLLADLLPTVDGQHFNAVHIFCNVADLLRRLHCQFSGGTEDHRLQPAQVRVDLLQGRDGKGRRLARTGLCLPDNILIFQQIGNRLHLDRRKLLESHLPYRTDNSGIQKRLNGCQTVGLPLLFLHLRILFRLSFLHNFCVPCCSQLLSYIRSSHFTRLSHL